MQFDYIVVGQGLAGSILAYTLIKNQREVLVIDDPSQPKASHAAAGIYNPITGRKMVRTWMLDEIFPFLHEFYPQLEQDLEVKLMHEIPMYRPFLTMQEQNEWEAKRFDPLYSTYINDLITDNSSPEWVRGEHGGMVLKRCGFVDTPKLVAEMSHWLRQQNRLLLTPFDYQKLSIDVDQISYETFTASKIIFCEGPNLRANPYFNWLPLRPVKGETLDVQFQAPLPFMVNRGVFALPIDTIARIGSTFERKDLSWSCSEMGRSELEERLQRLIFKPYRVLAQNAGIRPATEDKRPFIGIHPKYEPLGVFNGLGTKGVSLAPYWAQEFFKFLELGLPLLPEVSINRYF